MPLIPPPKHHQRVRGLGMKAAIGNSALPRTEVLGISAATAK
jgi:hypothetical protein